MTDSPRITLLPRLLFGVTYLVTLIAFFRREKTFTNLLVFATLGFLCYYTFNTGVHENHLFLVAILAAALYWLEEGWRLYAVLLILMANINMFLFYCMDGVLHFPRLFLGVDVALPLAALYVLYFVFLFWTVVVGARQQRRLEDAAFLGLNAQGYRSAAKTNVIVLAALL